ncbi:hypothetical protein [Dethiosulfatarculus sandiegensis]|uniref:hypothetical protein n=1 Tax=Dethiosulfatarculus sandiegensis TaxID=1429043 RepID=UPI0012E11E0D|nr:hypothetical protein [Dethiosulfatarculus sandiegensis]
MAAKVISAVKNTGQLTNKNMPALNKYQGIINLKSITITFCSGLVSDWQGVEKWPLNTTKGKNRIISQFINRCPGNDTGQKPV